MWAGGLGCRRRLGACPTKPDGVPAWRELLGAFVYSGGIAPAHRHAERRLGRRELSRRWRIGYGIAAGALALVGFFVARSLTEKPAQVTALRHLAPDRA